MTKGLAKAGSLSRERERVRVRARALRQTSPDAERKLWQALRDRQLSGAKFRRQHPFGRYFADFACIDAMLIVELDGGQHFEPDAQRADQQRTSSLNALGFHVIRFPDREVLLELPAVLQSIHNALSSRLELPHPSPLPPAGEGANAKDSS